MSEIPSEDLEHCPDFDLESIRQRVSEDRYSVRSHTVAHMFKEGFHEGDVIEAILRGSVLEIYPEVCRCLILGFPILQSGEKMPLHVVCDYFDSQWIDVVTAYIPQKPWWDTPTRRGKGKQ
jgi:hypothetical protein